MIWAAGMTVGLSDALSAIWNHPLPWTNAYLTTPLVVLSLISSAGLALLFVLVRRLSSASQARRILFLVTVGTSAAVLWASLNLKHPKFTSISLAFLIAVGSACAFVWLFRRQGDRLLEKILLGTPLILAILLLSGFTRRDLRNESVALVVAIGAAAVASSIGSVWWIWKRGRRAARWELALCTVGVLVAAATTPLMPAHAVAGPSSVLGGTTSRPSILLITIDALRADRGPCLKAYTGDEESTLSLLCRVATRYDDASSPAPWTLPSFASLMTGVRPQVHRATQWESTLPRELKTLAQSLRSRGYRTAAVVTNVNLDPKRGFARGFSTFDYLPMTLADYSIGLRLTEKLLGGGYRARTLSPGIVALSEHVLAEPHSEKPVFLWSHFLDPHAPYTPPASRVDAADRPPGMTGTSFDPQHVIIENGKALDAAERDWVRSLYDAEVIDEYSWVNELLAYWRASGRWDQSLIILTSDHGEEFWEHGHVMHGYDLYQPELHVPLLVKYPGQEHGDRVEKPVTTLDLHQLILDVGAEEALKNMHSEMAGPVVSTGIFPPPLGTGGSAPKTSMLRKGLFKLIWDEDTGATELYDLSRDPSESVDLSSNRPELLANMLHALEMELGNDDKMLRQLGVTPGLLDKLTKDKADDLRALGYL